MLKHKYAVAAALTGVSVLSAAIPVAADPVVEQFNENGVYVFTAQSPDCNIPGLPDLNIPAPEIPSQPDNSLPETPELPEQPEVTPPETDIPETEIPDQDDGMENTSFAGRVIELVNQERAKEGLPALQYDEDIEKAALVRAKETEISFSHTRPNGSSFSTALSENGVSFRGSGENIAWGQKSPEEVMKGWMNSQGHRANIMNKNFTKIGVGYYQNSNGVNYWTQLFTY